MQTLFPQGLSGIIYDCDGVMINSRAVNTRFYNRVLAYFGLPPMTEEQERYSFMATGLESLRHILPKHLHSEIHHVATEVISYERDFVPQLELIDGFRQFVLEMRDLGLRQAMCTNRTDEGFAAVMEFLHFPACFDPIMTSSKVAAKPSPEGAIRIAQIWNVARETILFVGDSPTDRACAKGAGEVFAAFNGIDLAGDLVVETYPELKCLLAEVLPKR